MDNSTLEAMAETIRTHFTIEEVAQLSRMIGQQHTLAAQLSPRQLQVVERAAKGLADCQIAGELGIGESTVGKHLDKVYRKLGIRCRAELIARWLG